MRQHTVTESERTLIAMALRNKAEGDQKAAGGIADPAGPGLQSLKAQFERQAADATRLANLFEEAESIDVWLNETIDGDDQDAIDRHIADGERAAMEIAISKSEDGVPGQGV